MESFLGFKEPPQSDVVFDKSLSLKLVPWINWDEWDFVRVSLFSSSPQSIASALQRITAWRSRGCLPVVIEVTASIIEIQQKDPFFRNGSSGEAVESEEMLAMLYCMAIMRLVNGVIEKTRKKTEVSIAEAASAIGIPRVLIDIRHEGSHRDLPSLHLVRLASVKAVDWLKEYYWEPQKNSIPDQRDTATNLRSEIEHKLYELAFCLREKRSFRSETSLVKGKRVNHLERFCGPNKFVSLLTMKHGYSKCSGSKKLVNKLLKNVLRLYSSSSGEVVDVLLELFLKALDSSDAVELTGNQEHSHTAENMPTVFVLWKPVVIKLSNKEPELPWSLLKAVIENVETGGARKFETDEHLLSDPVAESRQIEQLATLFEWLVRNLLKSARLSDPATETEEFSIERSYPKATKFEILRKCLVATSHGNHRLMTSALSLARMMMGNKSLISKLEKLLPLSIPDQDVGEAFPSEVSISERLLSHEQEVINEAAKRLELIKHHRKKNENVEPKLNHEKKMRWGIVKSWNPCPIGMLPHTLSSSGRLPILDCSFDSPETPKLASSEDQPELNQSSRKRESESDADHLDKPNLKKLRETVEGCENDDQENSTPEDFRGHLMIGGVWKKVSEAEVSAIASAIRILV